MYQKFFKIILNAVLQCFTLTLLTNLMKKFNSHLRLFSYEYETNNINKVILIKNEALLFQQSI